MQFETLTPEILQEIFEIIPSDGPFDNPNFDPIAYVNNQFPDEKSLENFDKFYDGIQIEIASLTNEVYSNLNDTSSNIGSIDSNLNNVTNTVSMLQDRVTRIEQNAINSAVFINSISKQLRTLDFTKKNLETYVEVLENLKIFINVLNKLEKLQPTEKLTEVSNLLPHLKDLRDFFKKYKNLSQIFVLLARSDTIVQFYSVKCVNQFKELNPPGLGSIDGSISTLDIDVSDTFSAMFQSTCEVIYALGDEYKQECLNFFIDTQLKFFRVGKPLADNIQDAVVEIRQRIQWIQNFLKAFYNTYDQLFPVNWQVGPILVSNMLNVLIPVISSFLMTYGNTLELNSFLSLYNTCRTTERELQLKCEEEFLKTESDKFYSIFLTNQIKEKFLAQFSYLGEDIDDFEITPLLKKTQAIREKYRSEIVKQETIEMEKLFQAEQELQKLNDKKEVPFSFVNSILPAFFSHFHVYVKEERKNLDKILENNTKKNEECEKEMLQAFFDSFDQSIIHFDPFGTDDYNFKISTPPPNTGSTSVLPPTLSSRPGSVFEPKMHFRKIYPVCDEVILNISVSMSRCVKIDKGQVFYDFSKMLNEFIDAFCQQKLAHISNLATLFKTKNIYFIQAILTCNSFDYFIDVLPMINKKMANQIDSAFKDELKQIELTPLFDVVDKCLEVISKILLKKIAKYLKFKNLEIFKMILVLKSLFKRIIDFLSPPLFYPLIQCFLNSLALNFKVDVQTISEIPSVEEVTHVFAQFFTFVTDFKLFLFELNESSDFKASVEDLCDWELRYLAALLASQVFHSDTDILEMMREWLNEEKNVFTDEMGKEFICKVRESS
eukprot:TRINITY_DN1662_c0_g1_i1.p1 TRINITY_DN1662_c0_g1~~TRINITY_DN1662_c0_g1_i1.p1  ORF type:complete len:833 (-),score=231.15 TRINITY_DN1662_c0_g1_i1:40-2538(-)